MAHSAWEDWDALALLVDRLKPIGNDRGRNHGDAKQAETCFLIAV